MLSRCGILQKRTLPEEKEEASTHQFNIQAQLDEFIEELKKVWDVRERQHKQRFFQLTEEKNKHDIS